MLKTLTRIFSKPAVAPATPGQAAMSMRVLSPMQAGVYVDEHSAMSLSAVYRCINVISSAIAALPWGVYRPVGMQDSEPDRENPVWNLIHDRPNPEMPAFIWRETIMSHALAWGNGYAEIERARDGTPVALWLLTPDRTSVGRDDRGRVIYKVRPERGGEETVLPASDVFHLRGLGFDGLVGYSVVTLARRAMGLGLSAEQFGASLFANGAFPGGIITHPKTLSDTARANLKESIQANHGGSKNVGKMMLFEEDMKFSQTGIPPEDAQFLETRVFQVREIARWFGVPPNKVVDFERATYSNVEQMQLAFVQDTLLPWCARLEQEANYKLLDGGSNFEFTKIQLNGLMRGDTAARVNYYTQMRRLGVLSINEIRRLEDMNGIGDLGELRMVEQNMMPLEQAVNGQSPEQTQARGPGAEVVRPVLEATCARIYSREGQSILRAAKGRDAAKMAEWAAEWYPKHMGYVAEELSPVVAAIVRAEGAEADHAEIAASIACEHCEANMAAVCAAESPEAVVVGWDKSGSAKALADKVMERAAQAAVVEAVP